MDGSISQISEERGNNTPRSQQPKHILIIVMGVSGTGKSTLGIALAQSLGLPYVEGDNLHPKHNVDKMSDGIPLTDADREPWLELIRTTAEHMMVEQQGHSRENTGDDTASTEHGSLDGRVRGVVISCSALKRYYRDILRGRQKPSTTAKPSELPVFLEAAEKDIPPTYFVFIDGPKQLLRERMETRPGHFMKASMLDGQLNTLESPIGEDGVIVVPLESDTEEQVQMAKMELERLGWTFNI